MFKNLTIHDGIIHKGKTYYFHLGETAIVGPNGSGKSLLVEYLAFALFGSCALRGKVADYKNLNVSLTVEIKGEPYVINRNTKECTITRLNDDSPYCYGTKPCNLEIIRLLGYDYNVYKMANYAEQLDILGLGKLKPSERKTALDRTLGIGVIDKLIKHAKDRATEYRQRAEAIESTLIDPGEEPVKPEGFRDPIEIAKEYEEKKKLGESYDVFIKKSRPEKPKAPEIKPELDNISVSEAIDKCGERIRLETELKQLQATEKPHIWKEEGEKFREQWSKYHDYEDYLKKLEAFKGDEPSYTKEELDKIKQAKEDWFVYERELRSYETGQVTCPHCKGTFNPYNEKPIPPTVDKYENIDYKEIETQYELNRLKNLRETLDVVEPVEEPEFCESYLMKERITLSKWESAQSKLKEVEAELKKVALFTNDFTDKVIAYQEAKSVYLVKKGNYEKDLAEYEEEAQKFIHFNPIKNIGEINQLVNLHSVCRDYVDKHQQWATLNDIYQLNLVKVTDERAQQTKYQEAQEKLLDMKTQIKGYVLPSLQKVSSILLSEMSDGLYQSVQIDPDFNILVEGREINLFSGSEQAMINLALRLGLGQVLTCKTFSVFIGDEIDAAMSEERAQLTADCLRKVSKYIKQTILISHRNIEAEHYINLGEKIMEFKIELERLTEEQLEALRKINNSVVETEIKRRKEITYSDEEMRAHKVFADLSKAYFFLKPMYDNMRNNDVKKTITQSEILPTLEKVFRYADQHKMAFEKYEGEPVVKEVAEPLMRSGEPTPIEKAIEEATPVQAEATPVVEPVIEPSVAESVWEPGGGADIEQPTPIVSGIAAPVTECADPGIAAPVTTECVDPGIAAPIEIITSPVEKMNTEELNKILANIPTVEKI